MQTKNKRDDVIQATLEIIAENGFHNAPTSLIAERANVGMGTIYRYFKNKDELIQTIYFERAKIAKEHALSDYDATRPHKESYTKFCRHFFDYMINNPLDYNFFEQYRSSPYGLKEQLEIMFGFVHGEGAEQYPMLQLFKEGQELKVIKDMKLHLLVALTMSHIFTLARHQVSGVHEIEDKEIDQFFSASWDSVRR